MQTGDTDLTLAGQQRRQARQKVAQADPESCEAGVPGKPLLACWGGKQDEWIRPG